MNRKQRRAEKQPDDPRRKEADAALDQALVEHRKGNFAAAVAGYRQVLALAPRDADALMNLGRALTAQGRREEALQQFRAALAIWPRVGTMHRDFGIALNEFGLWSEAIAAFQRAAALSPGDVKVLTSLSEALIETGRRAEAVPVLQRAIAIDPLFGESYYWLHRALYDERNLGPAIDALSLAVVNDPGMVLARFSLGVALDRRGDHAAALEQFENLHADKSVYRGAVDSWRYARSKSTPATRWLSTTRETLLFALEEAKLDGLVLELGVRYGISTRWLAERLDGGTLHGFDSFEGLPEEWHVLPKGVYSTHGALPPVPANVELHVGLFEATLPGFVATHEGPVRFVNIDCDLYSATACGLELLGDRIVPGTVIVFDEYLLNDEWRNDEYKAFQEAVARRGWRYEYLAFSLYSGQAAVRILG
jgi:tetratricopeptide (TPR) repeat protein